MNTTINTDINLRNQLVMDYMPIVRTIAHQYRGSLISEADLIQEGAIGLIMAADRYLRACQRAETKATQAPTLTFEAYAPWWVRKYILRAFSEYGHPVRLPRHAEQDLDFWTLSLDMRVRNADEDGIRPTYGELLPSDAPSIEDVLTQRQFSQLLHRAIVRLPEPLRNTLYHLYGLRGYPELTVQELAEQTGADSNYIYLMHHRALARIREFMIK